MQKKEPIRLLAAGGLLTLIALHTAEYFHIGRRIAAEHGMSPAEGLLNCLAYGFTWWLPLERGE